MPTSARADAGDISAYLKARAADGDGNVASAAADYARALVDAPDSTVVAAHAYRVALSAGDDALAARAAVALANAGVAPSDAALIPLSTAARANDADAVDAALDSLTSGPLGVIVTALHGWSAFARHADPLGVLKSSDLVARRFAAENRALLLIATGQPQAGIDAIMALGGAAAPIDLRIAAAQLLLAAKRVAPARALLAEDSALFARLAAGAPAAASLAFGVSRLLTRLAADLATAEPSPLAIALTRAALRAEPGNDRARMLLAEALSRAGATDQALGALDDVKPSSAFTEAARAERVGVLAAADRGPEAIAAAKALAERLGATAADWQAYGDRLAAAQRFDDAAGAYLRVIGSQSGADWTAWLQYGAALERGGRWPEARVALERAVALAPDQPLALNYLGYARIARGEDVAASAKLLEHASALKPEDASIIDSLGWAYHLRGDPRALALLERAGAADPGNAEIGEHLGDAYWHAGRRYEARYAWSAAALTAAGKDSQRLADKVASGLPTAPRRQ